WWLRDLEIRIVTRRAPAPEHERPVHGAEGRADDDHRPETEPAWRDEPLHQPSENEPRRGSQHDLDGDTRFRGERRAPAAVAGAHERPSHPQPRRAGDHDA